MFSIGLGEWLIIFTVLLIFFGPEKLPELARSFGKAIREFKKATEGESKESKLGKLERTAREMGVETEGKSREEILDEVIEESKHGKERAG